MMVVRVDINLHFGDHLYDEDAHNRLVAAAKDVSMWGIVFVFNKSMWLSSILDEPKAMLLGAALQKQFPKRNLKFTITKEFGELHEIQDMCEREAIDTYAHYLVKLQRQEIPTLFGTEGIATFANLPKFFRKGTVVRER